MKIIKNIVCMAFLSFAFFGSLAQADIYEQDFDTWTGAPQSGYTASTDSSGWSASGTRVDAGGRGLSPYAGDYLAAVDLNGYVLSPNLTNGVGDISFRYGVDGDLTVVFDVQISSDGSNWTTLDTLSTASVTTKTWHEYSTNSVNQYGDSYFRVIVTSHSSSSRFFALDSIVLTEAVPDVNITDTTVTPDNIYDGDEVTVVTAVELLGSVQNLAVNAYWKKPGGTWASINMTNTTGNAYVASSTIPSQIAGTKVEYYVETTFGGVNSPKYSPTGGATSPYSYTVQAEAFTSKFDSMDVDIVPVISPPGFPQTVTMFLDDNGFRQGVSLYNGYIQGVSFTLDATTTNSVDQTYGTSSTNSFTTPFTDDLVLGGDSFSVPENLVAQVLFRVDEDDMSVNVQKCTYMDFTSWPTTSGYADSTYTFANKIWSAYNTYITTDNERKFRGKAAYLNSTGDTSYVMSPSISADEGFGELTFWYRNYTDSGVATSFDIQVSGTGGTSEADWTTVTNVTDIYTTEYLRFTLLMNDRASRYVRIKNTGNANLCIDDIVIGYAGAGVVLDNIVADPAAPNVLDEVYMYADITALQGADITVAKLYYRFGTNGNYKDIGMINRSGITYDASQPFEKGCNGILQYYFEVQFEGDRGAEIAYYPSGAGETPYELVYTDISFSQNFDAWPGAPQSAFGDTSDTTGWSVSNTKVAEGTRGIAPYSGSYCALLDYEGYVQSPMMTNGVGVLNFMYALDGEDNYEIEIQSSTDGIIWQNEDTVSVSLPKTTWISYSKVLLITDSVYLRIKMSSPAVSRLLVIDDIVVTLPASMVTIGTITRTPAYASYNEPVDINCYLSSANSKLPSVDISGKIFYRKKDSGLPFNSVDMEDVDYGNFLGTIPAGVVQSGDIIEYYIQSNFKGYSYNDALNFSPTYSPEGVIVQGSSYYAPPTEYFEYDTRRFISDVGSMTVNVTNNVDTTVTPVTMSQYSDNIWQGIVSMGDYEEIFLNINVGSIKLNTASFPSNIVYGDGTQVETIPPIVAQAKADKPSIEITGVTNQQYVVRLNMLSEEYILLACDAQDFDDWFLDSQYYAVGNNTQGGANKWSTGFDGWSLSQEQSVSIDFNDTLWVNPSGLYSYWLYPDQTSSTVDFWVEYSYQIWNTKLFNNPTNNTAVAQIETDKLKAFMFPTALSSIHDYGVGSVSFKYKVVDDNLYTVSADMTLTNAFVSDTDYRVEAQVKGYGENFDDGNYHAIRLREVDDNNYVECRVVQTRGNKFYLQIWLCEGGTLTLKGTATGGTDSYGEYQGYKGSLESGGIFVGKIKDNSTYGSITVVVGYDSPTDYNRTLTRTFTSTVLYGVAASYGFAASGANMIVSSYFVNSYDGGSAWWSESFYQNEFSVMQFNDNWLHVVTTNENLSVDGRLERMGVGNLAPADSTGLSVAIDPGDDTFAVSENIYDWIPYSYDRGLNNLYYKEMVVNVNTADNAFAIIHRSSTGDDEELSVRVYDVEVTGWVGDVVTTNDWKNNYGWLKDEQATNNGVVYMNNYVELMRSKTPALERQYIASPQYTTLGSFGFEYNIPSNSVLPDLKVWRATNPSYSATWVLVASNIVNESTERDTWNMFSMAANVDATGYLIIENASSLASDAVIKIDDIAIYPYGAGGPNSWVAYNARLTGDGDIFDGSQSGFLNLDGTSDTLDGNDYNQYEPYVRTPELLKGIGEISFWYASVSNESATLPYAHLRIEKSATGEDYDWQKIYDIYVDSSDYSQFTTNLYDMESKYVRFINVTSNGVPQRLAIDELLVIDPYATTLDIQNVRTDPEQPLSTNVVKVLADLTNYKFGPYDIVPKAYYYYGTNNWGTWKTNNASGVLEMELVAVDTNVSPTVYTYQTSSGIPVTNPDICVQYFVTASYKGEIFADKTSPSIFREALSNPTWYEPINYYQQYGSTYENNPYYVVFSCPTGAVWFNEVNVVDGAYDDYGWEEETGTNSYVELAGKADVDISGWHIDLYNDYNQKQITYTLPSGSKLSSDNDGYGFWVIGAPEVVEKNMAFTLDFDECYAGPNYLILDGGIVLRRGFGAEEYKICYQSRALEAYGYEYIGDDYGVAGDYSFIYKSLQLRGDGSNYYNFAWSWEDGFTPGTVNIGQTISGGGSNDFSITVTDYWFDGATVYIVSEGTGDWTEPEVWYSTNLTVDTPEWSELSGVTSETSGSIVTQYFDISASPTSPTTYYRIQGQD